MGDEEFKQNYDKVLKFVYENTENENEKQVCFSSILMLEIPNLTLPDHRFLLTVQRIPVRFQSDD